jgi:hypothetical protein
MLGRVMNENAGSIIVSVILGLGLAAMFRKVCKGDSCVIVKAPNAGEVAKYYWKIDQDCFKYNPRVIPCPNKNA